MKKILFILICIFIIFSNNIYSQCNVQKIIKENGLNVRYTRPEPVGKGNNFELGLSIQTTTVNTELVVTVFYKSNPKKNIKNILIQLDNGNYLDLKLIHSEIAQADNNIACMSTYMLTNIDIQKIKKSKIKSIVFKQEKDLNQVVMPIYNYDILIRHSKCLNL